MCVCCRWLVKWWFADYVADAIRLAVKCNINLVLERGHRENICWVIQYTSQRVCSILIDPKDNNVVAVEDMVKKWSKCMVLLLFVRHLIKSRCHIERQEIIVNCLYLLWSRFSTFLTMLFNVLAEVQTTPSIHNLKSSFFANLSLDHDSLNCN